MATYLVTGATGQQGGFVVDHLLAAGVKNIHAVVRDTSAPKAVALRERGVKLFQGTHEEPDQVFREAAKGCSAMFFNPTIFTPGEARKQADAIIAAAKAGAGSTLQCVVLSSTNRVDELKDSLDQLAPLQFFMPMYYGAKAEVEAAVQESGIAHVTILRPPVLMYDVLLPASATAFPDLPRHGKLITSLDKGATMPFLDPEDVARYAVAAMLDPHKFSGHGIDLASENLTWEELRDVLARVSGVDVEFHRRTPDEVKAYAAAPNFSAFELVTNWRGRVVDVDAAPNKYGIKLTSLEEFLTKNKEKLLDSLPPRSAKFLSD